MKRVKASELGQRAEPFLERVSWLPNRRIEWALKELKQGSMLYGRNLEGHICQGDMDSLYEMSDYCSG